MPANELSDRYIVEYRLNIGADWFRSHFPWDESEIPKMNKITGWEKYRVRYLEK